MAIIQDDKVLIELELDKDFVAHLKYLQDKYGEDMTKLNTMHNDNFNFSSFINNFVDSKNPESARYDTSKSSKDICGLEVEMVKPHNKLLGFNKIFFEFRKHFGIETAKRWLETEWNGGTYLHDASSVTYKPYCFAYDLDKMVEKGLYFIDKFPSAPAKHLTTFNDHVLETVSWLCNRSSGAVGLVSYIVYSWWFWDTDVKNNHVLKDPEYYRRQYFQKFIYDLNQPYLRNSIISAFTNVSIMDRCYLEELFGGRQFPDGRFAIDHIEEILEHQKVFMEVVSEIRETLMMTYPVLTYSLLFQNGKFVDEEFARWCSDHNTKWADSNFYCGSDVTSLSNCCFGHSQEITIKLGEETFTGPMKRMYQAFGHRDDIFINSNGEWKKCKLTAFEQTVPMYEVKTWGGYEMLTTHDHIHPIFNGVDDTHEDIKTYNLVPGMLVKVDENGKELYTSISSCERVDYDDEWVFCVEMEDKSYPYFNLANGILTHNCRLISQTDKLDAFINSIGGTSLSIGSVKVNTINLRRIALEAEGSQEKYMEILTERLDITVKALDIVRKIITRNIEKGLLPNYTSGMLEMDKQYNTIGITAMYEALCEFDYIATDSLGNKSYTDEGIAFSAAIMNHLNKKKEEYGFDYSLNIENIPGERANVISSIKDMNLYPESEKYQLYSNQWIPLSERCTLHEKIRLGAKLDKECGGGQISHINIDGPFTNKDQAWELLNYIADKGVIYFAFNLIISTCTDRHSFHGDICPKCGKVANEKFTRIVGFYTPISTWGNERRDEFDQRTWFDIASMRGVDECE